jgi:hypothetical protein
MRIADLHTAELPLTGAGKLNRQAVVAMFS